MSLSQLCSSSPAEVTSDVPLRGPITTLFPVENERTKEQLIVGGADDGSIAFWSAEYVFDLWDCELVYLQSHKDAKDMRTLDDVQFSSSTCNPHQRRRRGETEGVSSVRCTGRYNRGP